MQHYLSMTRTSSSSILHVLLIDGLRWCGHFSNLEKVAVNRRHGDHWDMLLSSTDTLADNLCYERESEAIE